MKAAGVENSGLTSNYFAFAIIKLSGFIFYSLETGPGNVLKFKRTFGDFIAFGLSFSFSIAAFWFVGQDRFEGKLKSVIAVNGAELLFKLLLGSIIVSKILNLSS